jgi:hypothetical protein
MIKVFPEGSSRVFSKAFAAALFINSAGWITAILIFDIWGVRANPSERSLI